MLVEKFSCPQFPISAVTAMASAGLEDLTKAVADGPVGQVLAGPLFLKVKTKFHFSKSK